MIREIVHGGSLQKLAYQTDCIEILQLFTIAQQPSVMLKQFDINSLFASEVLQSIQFLLSLPCRASRKTCSQRLSQDVQLLVNKLIQLA